MSAMLSLPVPQLPTESSQSSVPLLIMTVDVGNGRQDTLPIYDGDRAEDLASSFARKHGLNKTVTKQLEGLIKRKKLDAGVFISSRGSLSRNSNSRQNSVFGGAMVQSRSMDQLAVTSPRSFSAMKSTQQPASKPSNYGEWMYQRELQSKEKRRLNQLRETGRQTLPTSPPRTSKNSSRVRSTSVSTENVLIQRGEATRQKIKNLRSKAMADELQSCTFKPAVNPRSERIDRSASASRGLDRFNKLYSDAYDKELRQYDRLETAVRTEFPFRPATISTRKNPETQSAMVNRLLNSKKNFENVVSKLKEELDTSFQAKLSFHPATGRGPLAPKYERRGPVHQHLYDQRNHTQVITQKLREQEEALRSIPIKLSLAKSDELAETSQTRQLQLLFNRLDHDQDGFIDFATLNLDAIDTRTIQLLGPVWSELSQSAEQLGVDRFVGICEGIIRKASNEEKNYLLRGGGSAQIQQENAGGVMISKTSEELAGKRKEQLGADIYTRRLVEKQLTAEKLKTIKQHLAVEEMKECTFRPTVNVYKRSTS